MLISSTAARTRTLLGTWRQRVSPLLVALAWACANPSCPAADTLPNSPRVFAADAQTLATVKTNIASRSAAWQPALRGLIADADKALATKPVTVMDKKQMPPSGDKHDYMSQAPYFWRDTNSPDGKYIRRDGERNPESGADSDAGRLGKVCGTARTLALAFYFTGDEKYAARAAGLLRVFFLDPATRMHPNLNYGQGIPGEVEGRPAGLISARSLVDMVDAVGLLAGSKAWTAADQAGMTDWVGNYFTWLTTSKIGRGEAAASNNHGTFYDVQATALALFVGKTNEAKAILLAAREKRIAGQIQPDGQMPRELARTLSFNYSVFNLRALIELATLGQGAGVDLWHYQTPDGRSLLQALEFMAPYADPKREWPFKQIHAPNRPDLGELMLRAAVEYPGSKPIQAALKFYQAGDFANKPARLYLKMAPPESALAH